MGAVVELPGGRIASYEVIGHFPEVEARDACRREVAGFLKAVSLCVVSLCAVSSGAVSSGAVRSPAMSSRMVSRGLSGPDPLSARQGSPSRIGLRP